MTAMSARPRLPYCCEIDLFIDLVMAAITPFRTYEGTPDEYGDSEPTSEQRGWRALEYAGQEMKNDAAIVMAAVRQCGFALEHAGEAMKNDAKIVQAAVQQDGLALEFASQEMKDTEQICIAACSCTNLETTTIQHHSLWIRGNSCS